MKEETTELDRTLLRQFAKGNTGKAADSTVQNCVIYTRVSSKEQMETNQSLGWQKKYCTEYALKNKLLVKGEFGGTYESAKSDERQEFNRMLKFVKASREKISYILVYSLDRFSRTGDSAIYIAGQLKKAGVNIIAVTQPIDTNSHAGVLQQNIQFIFSKYDNDLRRQKTIDGMREKLLKGDWIGHAPKGYSFVKGADQQTIIINEDGKLIKLAFEWRANGISYESIVLSLKDRGMIMPKQTLSDIFRNPFYCGLMSHNLLNGELVKGNHPPLIEQELFLRANEMKKTDGFKSNKAHDHLPLKVFVKDAESGVPFTGYLVKKKGLYYYKVNKVGIKINRSARMMHDKFKEELQKYTILNLHVEPLKVQLHYTWENLTEQSSDEKRALTVKLNELEEEFYNLRKRYALGKVMEDIYQEFATEMQKSKEAILKKMQELENRLSNPKELINDTCYMAANLAPVWESYNYFEKQNFQNVLFPNGLLYDAKLEQYRTPRVNSVFGYVAQLSRVLEENKNRPSYLLNKKAGSVLPTGIEPVQP